MDRSRRLLATAALLLGVVAWTVVPPVVSAQSDTVVIELSFETDDGQPPAGGAAVLDLNTGTEYRNARVADGEPIEVDATAGATTRLQVRRTELQPAAVSCDGADSAETVVTSQGVSVVITPGDDRVVCTVSLSDDVPVPGPPEELAATGLSTTLIASLGAVLVGEGALMIVASRVRRD